MPNPRALPWVSNRSSSSINHFFFFSLSWTCHYVNLPANLCLYRIIISKKGVSFYLKKKTKAVLLFL